MRHSNYFKALCLCLLPILGYSQANSSLEGTKMILTVEEVRVKIQPSFQVEAIKVVDAKENRFSFTSPTFNDMNKWFENATVEGVSAPKDTPLKGGKENEYVYYVYVADSAKLLYKFRVNGKIYPIGVGTGSKFVVQKNAAGKYTLFPEETAKLSPPPTEKE